MKKTKTQPRTIQSLDRAMAILNVLASESEGLLLRQISGRIGLAPQTTQGLLRTLEVHEMVMQMEKGSPYFLGPHMHRLEQKWIDSHGRILPVGKEVCALAESLGEYVLLSEFRGDRLMRLAEANPQRPLMVAPGIETANRLHTMATAKVQIAFMDESRIERLVASMTFTPAGPNSPRNAAALYRQLEEIRRQGYVVCLEESGVGCGATAVPVRDDAGNVIAGVGTALPMARFAPSRRKPIRRQLAAAAETIGKLLAPAVHHAMSTA